MHSTDLTRLRRASLLAFLVGLLGHAGCTAATQDNFTNPPGPPPSCTQVQALAGCTEGSLSYSCTTARPDDGDTNLVCDRGTPGVGFEGGAPTLFCCAPYGQWASECAPSNVAGCGAESFGFSCSAGTSPDQVDTSLVCSEAVPSPGGTSDYCCISFSQSSGVCRCASFDQGLGTCGGAASTSCPGASVGLSCASGHRPTEVNPVLVCSAPDGGSVGAYCCQTP
jgi:hypothetical protein